MPRKTLGKNRPNPTQHNSLPLKRNYKRLMVEIRLHTPIGSEDENRWMAMWGAEDSVFSLDTLQRIFDENPAETDFRFNIHCDGGLVSEGLAIYDALRTSGRNIHCNIEGGCHSMAVCILLAAPYGNRTANPNCRALIHKVYAPVYGYTTADELRSLADDVQREQDTILSIYEQRTGTDRATLESLMREEKERTADELLQYGFISKINSYNTNSKRQTKMGKTLSQRLKDELVKLANLIDGDPVNYEHYDTEGQLLFTTESEDERLYVGLKASPDGTFTLADGRTVVISDGEITEIREEDTSGDNETLEELKAENTRLREALTEARNLLEEARNEIQSNYTPPARKTTANKGAKPAKTADDWKREMRERANKKRGGNN